MFIANQSYIWMEMNTRVERFEISIVLIDCALLVGLAIMLLFVIHATQHIA